MARFSRAGAAILRDKQAAVVLLLLLPIVAAALFADFVAPYKPLLTGVGPALVPPSSKYPMGTDQAGGDIYSQVIHGSRVALLVGAGSTLLALIIAILVGLPAGYYGGMIDEVLMRATDLILSIPSFVLIIFIVVLFGSRTDVIVFVIGAVSWPTLARITRAQALSLKEQEFILAVKALGAGSSNIMFFELLSNVWPSLVPAVTLQIGAAVLTECGLSFLGLGDPNMSSWGRTLWMASRSIYAGAWWGVILPGLATIMTILAFNAMGDALSRTMNPRTIKK
jgi:peptide/nickel transport system permease protein